MECRELNELAVDLLLGEAPEATRAEAARHLEACAGCREEMARVEKTWDALGQDPDAPATPAFRSRALALIEDEMLRQRIRTFRPASRWPRVAAAAATLLLAAGAGAYLARRDGAPAAAAGARAELPALEPQARLSNVSYRPADKTGRIGVSFDVESHRTVTGRPEDPQMAKLLAYLVSRGSQTAGEKSQAIEQVSTHYGARTAAASPDIVRALATTLRRDGNPGVRKKAADALAGFAMTAESRAAFLDALAHDSNPAVRLTAVEALAAAAKESPDQRTIDSLRETAFDPAENGFVRARAASALKAVQF